MPPQVGVELRQGWSLGAGSSIGSQHMSMNYYIWNFYTYRQSKTRSRHKWANEGQRPHVIQL